MPMTQDQRWEPPGPGRWLLERDASRTATFYRRSIDSAPIERGWQRAIERYRLPLGGVRHATVNGWPYLQFVQPMGRRIGLAASATAPWFEAPAHRAWREGAMQWLDSDRTARIERNLALQEVVPALLSDRELAAHLAAATTNDISGQEYLQAGAAGLLVVGEYLLACEAWGFDSHVVVDLLYGSSSTAADVQRHLADVAAPFRTRGVVPEALEQIESEPEASAGFHDYLRNWGWRLLGEDLDDPALIELPSLLLASVAAAASHPRQLRPPSDPPDRWAGLSSHDAARFDRLVADGRLAIAVREEVAGICGNWTRGLLRRALLETSIRLNDRGALLQLDHGVDLLPEEAMSLLRGHGGPAAERIAERFAERAHQDLLAAPPELSGHPSDVPDERSTASATRTAEALALASSLVATEPRPDQLADTGDLVSGTGIGDTVVRARALTVASESDAPRLVEAGSILVVPRVSTALAPVVPVLSGLVVETGGRLSHGAVLAAETALPAVVGAMDATARLQSGSLVELDATVGSIRVIEPATT